MKTEVCAVRALEAETNDPKEDCWDAPVGVRRAADVELVKYGASVSGVCVPKLTVVAMGLD